jgi:hypothetical protein
VGVVLVILLVLVCGVHLGRAIANAGGDGGRSDPSAGGGHVLRRPARPDRGPVRALLEHRSAPSALLETSQVRCPMRRLAADGGGNR